MANFVLFFCTMNIYSTTRLNQHYHPLMMIMFSFHFFHFLFAKIKHQFYSLFFFKMAIIYGQQKQKFNVHCHNKNKKGLLTTAKTKH